MTQTDMNYFEVKHLSTLELSSGDNTTRFLQSQVTSDISLLKPNHGTPSLLCNRRGQVITDVYIQAHNDHWQLTLPTIFLDRLLKYWKPLLRLSSINHTLNANQYRYYVIEKPQSGAIALSPKLPDAHHLIVADSPDRWLTTAEEHQPNTLEEIKIRQKIASMTLDNTERLLPQQLGYTAHQLIDFKKGCYLGQEVIARVEFKSNKQFFPLLISLPHTADLSQSSLMHERKPIGKLVYSLKCAQEILALGYISNNNLALSTITLADSHTPITLIER